MCRNNAAKKELLVTFGMMALALMLLLSPRNTLASFCQADINNDGKVNYSDLMILDAEMGRNNCSILPCQADINDDGMVNVPDREILYTEFGRGNCLPTRKDRQVLMQITDEKVDADSDEHKEENILSDKMFVEHFEEGIIQPLTRFKDNGDGTVTDSSAGLMWTKDANLLGDTLLFHQAISYINGMNEGKHPNFGYTDWRIPTLKELQSLIEYKEFTSKGHVLPGGHPFKNVQSLRFYDRSSPSYLTRTEHTWLVYAYCSILGHNVESCFGFVWPVRGGQ